MTRALATLFAISIASAADMNGPPSAGLIQPSCRHSQSHPQKGQKAEKSNGPPRSPASAGIRRAFSGKASSSQPVLTEGKGKQAANRRKLFGRYVAELQKTGLKAAGVNDRLKRADFELRAKSSAVLVYSLDRLPAKSKLRKTRILRPAIRQAAVIERTVYVRRLRH